MHTTNILTTLTVILSFFASNVIAAGPAELEARETRLCIGGAIKCTYASGNHCYDACTGGCECAATRDGTALTGSACAFGPTAANRAQCS